MSGSENQHAPWSGIAAPSSSPPNYQQGANTAMGTQTVTIGDQPGVGVESEMTHVVVHLLRLLGYLVLLIVGGFAFTGVILLFSEKESLQAMGLNIVLGLGSSVISAVVGFAAGRRS